VLIAIAGGFLAAAGLGIASYRSDATSPRFAQAQAMANKRARRALELARTVGVPPDGALALLQNQPEERGARLFTHACIECHTVHGSGGKKAPRLDQYLSRRWIRGVLVHPDAPEYYGNAKISGMESYQMLGDEKLSLLTDFLYALRSRAADDPSLESGRRLYRNEGCAECHSLVRGKDAGGPTLFRYGSPEWLRGLLRDPGAPSYYDVQNRMPDFGNRLAPEQIDDLVAFLVTLSHDEAELAGAP
jgi:mono/diheme cytochrome c family protein